MRCIKCGGKEINFNHREGKINCNFCGFLIEDNLVSQEISFEEKSEKKNSFKGQFIRNSNQNEYLTKNKNYEIILLSGRRKLNQLSNSLKLKPVYQEKAFKLFTLAFQKKFSNIYKLHFLCISCLYTICRREKTSHLLLDFSDITQIQTNKICTFFLKLVKILNINIPVIDPCLFIHRFIFQLNFGKKSFSITKSSLRLIARMKREWITTGRRPGGLCGAAILLAAKMHGIHKTQKEISNVVRIGDIALRMRLREINRTSISNMTIKQIDIGGGDDGNGNSVLDLYEKQNLVSLKLFDTTNFKKKIKIEPFDKDILNKFESKIFKFCLKKKIFENFLKKKNFFFLKKNLETNLNSKYQKILRKNDFLFYLNSSYEFLIKKNIWNEINSNYFFSNSILTRAQKEKPFAFFKMNIVQKTQKKN
jgi:transcription initiation factor TFIIIB Brf1 subunit/transcription initiation factor TFIIB